MKASWRLFRSKWTVITQKALKKRRNQKKKVKTINTKTHL